jgi:hypothetical protein
VLVWLRTEGNGENGKAFDLIEELALIGGQKDEDEAKARRLKSMLVDDSEHFPLGSWLALNDLFRNPYWLRLWVVQEIALGSSDMMMLQCGSRSISWHTLCRGVGVLHRHLWIVKKILFLDDQERA